MVNYGALVNSVELKRSNQAQNNSSRRRFSVDFFCGSHGVFNQSSPTSSPSRQNPKIRLVAFQTTTGMRKRVASELSFEKEAEGDSCWPAACDTLPTFWTISLQYMAAEERGQLARKIHSPYLEVGLPVSTRVRIPAMHM